MPTLKILTLLLLPLPKGAILLMFCFLPLACSAFLVSKGRSVWKGASCRKESSRPAAIRMR